MRFPTFPTLIRTFTLTNITATSILTTSALRNHHHPQATTLLHRRLLSQTRTLWSMPSIPAFLGSLFNGSGFHTTAKTDDNMADFPVQKSDSEWRAVLSPEQFRVIRDKGTEAPYTGQYDKHMPAQGTYSCAACSAPLYRATHKFKSGCGWPAYFDSLPGAVKRHTDSTLGMQRTEIVCANCGGHLGHVFKGEGYPTPTDERHCVNSVSLRFGGEDVGEGGEK